MLGLGFPSTGQVNIGATPPATVTFLPLPVASTESVIERNKRSRKQ